MQKLTPSQERLLRRLATSPVCIIYWKKTACRLLELGYASHKQEGLTWWTVTTDAGREWLKEMRHAR